MHGRGRGRFQNRGGRGRRPQIYSGQKVSLDSSIIFDGRFAQSQASFISDQPSFSAIEDTSHSKYAEADPFRASLDEFVRQQQERKRNEEGDISHLDFSKRQKRPDMFPQDKPFFCDKCYRGYNTKHMYEQHVASHVKCTYEGCSFAANPWFLAKHITNVHMMGVGSGSSSSNAFTDKWIAERRRKFPNKAAQVEKELAQDQKLQRGEVVTTSNRYGKFRINSLPTTTEPVTAPRISPTLAETSSDTVNKSEAVQQKSPTDELEDEPIPQKLQQILQQAESSIGQADLAHNRLKTTTHSKPSLIEMLLKDEIVHERNILLQCVKQVVSENFFMS